MKIVKISEHYYCVMEEIYTYANIIHKFHTSHIMRNGSFAETYIKKILEDIFKYAKDLRKDYMDYYNQEYADFKSYLYQKELLDKDEIDYLNVSDRHTILRLKLDLNSYNTSNLLEYEDNELDIINQLLEEIYNEIKK